MSAQFGRWNFDGRPIDPEYLHEVANLLSPYGPDGQHFHVADGLAFQFSAFHITKESHREAQPYLSPSGDVMTWDGILDNREELVRELAPEAGPEAGMDATDLSIAWSAWTRWGINAFRKLVGDWALAIWKPAEQTLVLAQDFIGSRHLYYYVCQDHASWSTLLDPLIILAERSFELDHEYIAGWLSHFPAAHLTPYLGVLNVPPASYVRIRNGHARTTKYWDFDASHRISYPRDSDYEEHFTTLLKTSVLRRLRSDASVLAELSGGVDSSSIVCVADMLVASGQGPANRIDTVSFYQEGEPSWDERPYVEVIEKARDRAGCHIDVSDHTLIRYDYDPDRPELTPVSRGERAEPVRKLSRYIACHGHRIVLSGVAGDELLGGAPSFIPQLADLLVTGRLILLLEELRAWAISNRTTVLALLSETLRAFLPWSQTVGNVRSAPWWDTRFLAAHRAAFSQCEHRFSLLPPRPSFQERLGTVEALRRQIASCVKAPQILCERRYPYLDRNLVEFLLAIPPDQLQRPGKRRLLMRRALANVVPEEVLNRKRKAFIARQPLVDVMSHWSAYRELTESSILVTLGIIDRRGLIAALEQARAGNIIPLPLLAHAVVLEKWLRHIRRYAFVSSLPGAVPSKLSPCREDNRHSISAEGTFL